MGNKHSLGKTVCNGSTQKSLPAGSDQGSEIETLDPALPPYLVREAVLTLWREILCLMLEGIIMPSKIGERLNVSTELVRRVQEDTPFIRIYEEAKKDLTVSAVDRIKAKAHIWVSKMEELVYSPDPHVARAALTDLLNRAGTAPAAKVDLGPAAYRKAVEKYIDVEPE